MKHAASRCGPGAHGHCADVRSKVNRLLDGRISTAKKAELRRHLRECPSCFSRFEFARLMRKAVREKVLCECCPGSLVAKIRLALHGAGARLKTRRA